ncbi:LbtU family siderophore porin [Thiospirillum jenense]|uniref:LbtU family siderophore porin n=1 Tax=Thiospirillum jenense TaxID=1653858 RepID=A0A839HHS0_9GAMM|nr:LbtU family siderophore porin [Thiospirillum jenense]MBB1126339.1 LbtU family siderophore porin [Thiospirillum jenense]
MRQLTFPPALAITSLLSSTAVAALDLNDQLTLDGLVEVEASYVQPDTGDSTSDVRVATVELGVTAQVNPWVAATVSLLYEQDETDLEVDIAQITLANPERLPWFATAGQFYLPFGSFETQLVSDPLTLELGEIRATALQVGFKQHGVTASMFAFNGDHAHSDDSDDSDDTQVDRWGGQVGFAAGDESTAISWSVDLGYLSDLGDTGSLQDVIVSDDSTAAWTVAAGAKFGAVQVIGEYLAATDRFDAGTLDYRDHGARPATWNVEAGYHFKLLGRDNVAAIGYQGSREALAVELPKQRWLIGWSAEVFKQTTLALEWSRDTDYERRAGGTGETSDSVVAQLAVSF